MLPARYTIYVLDIGESWSLKATHHLATLISVLISEAHKTSVQLISEIRTGKQGSHW
jgi:hypothetical protein